MSHLHELALEFAKEMPERSPGVSWKDACGVLCNQFVVKKQNWGIKPSGFGPTAKDVADHSGVLNTNSSAAPIGAWHFWNLGTSGHVGQDLDGGGTDVFMATGRAVVVPLAPFLGIQSVAGYNATGGVGYRGWATQYFGGVSAFAEPVVALQPTQRRVKPDNPVNRRTGPGTTFPKTGTQLKPNTVGNFVGWARGPVGDTIEPWFKGISGNWFVSFGFTDADTHDLADLN